MIVEKQENYKIEYVKNEELRNGRIGINKKGYYIKIIKIGGCNVEKQRREII